MNYDLWEEETERNKHRPKAITANHPTHPHMSTRMSIHMSLRMRTSMPQAPKQKLPVHAESYNPPEEYLWTEEEVPSCCSVLV